MEPLYTPQGVEERWQRTWEEEGLYAADPDPARESFVIAHPPPNVTGDLHLGHALQLSLADSLVRLRRMQGYNVLFQPGYDHAGISTQNAVEKALAREGRTRQELVRAVMRFFCHLYRRGWIYRANRIINWCPFHQTALSDLELVHVEVDDALTYARYPLVDGSGHVTVATVRPATILADVAV